jgi:acyl carrier protein
MQDTRTRLIKCFSAVFPELSEREIELASPASVGSWDSLANVTLLSVIEEEFQIEVPLEDLENLVSFGLILNYMQRGEACAA